MILLWGMSGDEPLTAVTASLHRRNEPYALIDQRDILDTKVELTIGPTMGGTITMRGESIPRQRLRPDPDPDEVVGPGRDPDQVVEGAKAVDRQEGPEVDHGALLRPVGGDP